MFPPQYDLYESDTFDSDDSHYGYDLSADRASNSADSSSSESHYSDVSAMRHGPHGFGYHYHGSVARAKMARDNTATHQDLQHLEFYGGIAGLLLSTEHPQDLKIKVGETIFPAHRCIVSIRTKFFSSALTESPTATDTITIEGHSACTVWSFLQWCYMGRYYFNEQTEVIPGTLMPSTPFQSMESEYTGADRHVRIYYLAKNLQCLELEEHVAHEYRKFWLQAGNWDRMSFLKSAREIFAGPINADGKLCCLRESVTSVAGRYHRRLKKEDGDEKEYEKLLKEVPGFAGGLIWGRSCGL